MKTETHQTKHTPGPWLDMNSHKPGCRNIAHQDPIDPRHTTFVCELSPSSETDANAQLIAAAPELMEACKYAMELIKLARQYFPKSIQNRHTFQLENTCAALGKAIHHAEAEPCPSTSAK